MSEILGATFVVVCGIAVIYGAFRLLDHAVALVINLICLPFMLSNAKKTNLHYYDHADRYFDFQQGQWIQKQ